jgi:hypothetical protein
MEDTHVNLEVLVQTETQHCDQQVQFLLTRNASRMTTGTAVFSCKSLLLKKTLEVLEHSGRNRFTARKHELDAALKRSRGVLLMIEDAPDEM